MGPNQGSRPPEFCGGWPNNAKAIQKSLEQSQTGKEKIDHDTADDSNSLNTLW
jgi:hypothetical protein